MAEKEKNLLGKMVSGLKESGQQVYGTRRTPVRTGLKVAIDAGTGFRDLKTNLAVKAAQAAKKRAAQLAAKRKVNTALKKAKKFDLSDLKAQAEANKTTNQELIDIMDQMHEQAQKDAQTTPAMPAAPATPAGRSKPSKGGPRMGSTAKASAGAAPRPNRRKGKVTVEEVQKRAAGGMAKKKRLKPSNVHPVKRAEKQLRDQMYKDRPPSADTRRMLEESTEDKINRANEEGVQESKTLPKTPKTPKAGKKAKPTKAGQKAKTPKASGPRMGSTAKAGAAAEIGALAGRRRKGKVTVEEVQKRAKGGIVKKKTSVQKKPRGVGAATRGYGRALR